MVNGVPLRLGHANLLAGVPLGDQLGWADQIIRHKLTVRGLEQRIAAARDKLVVFRPGKPTDWQVLERDLPDHLACPVVVTGDKSGKIGRESWRESMWQYVYVSGAAGAFKKKDSTQQS